MTNPLARIPTPATSHGAVLALLLLLSTTLAAQSAAPRPAGDERAGRLVGRVIDAETGAGITDAGVQVVGTTLGASSGVDGRYTVANVPAGTVTIQVRRIGYQPKTVTGLQLDPGRTLEQSISLSSAVVRLTATVVTAASERGTVAEALDRQRTSTGIVNAITTEQIARSPDADAAAAVQRVSGVTVQEGKFVFVRGLGERYTTTTLNGARIPSPEPERKVVPLDLFPAGLIQTITTSKTFTPDQQGDFSGAQVDIQTREFPARRRTSYAVGVGANAAAAGRDVLRAPTTGSEWLGAAGSERSLPRGLAGAGNFGSMFGTPEANQAARSFRNAWTPGTGAGLPNYSTSLSVGGQDPVAGHPVGYIASLSYAAGQEVRRAERVAASQPTAGGVEPVNVFDGSTGRQSVLWGGLLNLSTLVGPRTRLAFNNTYNRTSDNEARVDSGRYEALGSDIRRSTLRFVERSIRSNQLRGEHALGARHQLDWSLTSSAVRRREPDRSDLVYVRDEDPATGALLPYALLVQNISSSRRTFGDLRERNASADLRYRWSFGAGEHQGALRFGTFVRGTSRDADNRQFNLQLRPGTLSNEQRRAAAEKIFAGGFTDDTSRVFEVRNLSSGGTYDASDDVAAGFAMAEYPLTTRMRLVGGARAERATIRVHTQQTAGGDTTARLANTDLLPSLALNVRLTDAQNLRLSASRTLARPEYRELSPVTYFEVLGGGTVTGNAGLTRSLIQNYDARWEWYPDATELVSVGAFAKRFDDPIERVDLATSGEPQVTFVNADGATNYGVELELRKGLGFILERLAPFTAFTNATVMQSRIDVGNRAIVGGPGNRAMVGQAPYVLNGGLAYTSASGRTSATALFNRVGRRITTASVGTLDDTYEQPRNMLDLSLRVPLAATVAARFDARNLLDAPVEFRQGPVVRERYEVGRVFSVGFSWQR